MSEPMDDAMVSYLDAARLFDDLVSRVDRSVGWHGPGLGAWDLRALVGHTSRALTTVLDYLDRPADVETIGSAVQYYIEAVHHTADAEAIIRRGREAGDALGSSPGRAVSELVEKVEAAVRAADPEALITVLGGSMRVRSYLPTRTFELVVHALDISTASGVDVTIPESLLSDALSLAARIAVSLGRGRDVLTALTGRQALPKGFSVVP